MRREHRGAIRRADLRRVEEVLDGERDAGENAGRPSARVCALARRRLAAGALLTERRERPELRIYVGDPGKQRVDDLDGRQRAAAVCGEQLARRQPAGVGALGQPIPY
jgi:hypothetical protein